MGSFQTPISIYSAIERINRNEILLPAFQREYQWSAVQVENLFDSLMCGYPVSSFLFWKVKGDAKRAYRFYTVLRKYVEKFHTHNEHLDTSALNDFQAVLDGQQRLTSLYLGLCGSYAYHRPYSYWKNSPYNFPPRTLYLRLSASGSPATDEDEEETRRYKFLFREDSETGHDDVFTDKSGAKWFRVGKALDFVSGKDDLYDFAEEMSFSSDERKLVSRLEKVLIAPTINYYEEETTNPDEAVNIFVRINSGGSPLSMSQILMSMAVASWKKDARTEIFNLIDRVNELGFNIDTDYVFKAFLTLFHSQVRSSIKNFTIEFNNEIEDHWESVRDAILELFRLLKTFGLEARSLTSNNATLPILFYIYHNDKYRDFSTLSRHKEDREKIRRWLLRTLVLKSFGSSSDNAINRARMTMAEKGERKYGLTPTPTVGFPEAEISHALNQMQVVTDDFLDDLLATQKNERLSFAILSLLYPYLDYANYSFNKDHLHPEASWTKDLGVEWSDYNSIVNLQMLGENENKSKNRMPLAKWVEQEVKNGYPLPQFLSDHHIPSDVSLDLKDFAAFHATRQRFLRDLLRNALSASGVSHSNI